MSTSTAVPAPVAATATGPVRPRPDRHAGRLLPRAAWWVVCGCLAVLFLYPIGVMLAQVGVDDLRQIADTSRGLSVLQSLGNSAVVAVSATLMAVTASTLAGYAFARLPFPGSRAVFFVTLVTFMIPFQAIITPLYLVLRGVGLQNNLVGVALVLTVFNLPLGIFLMRNSFAAIPPSLEEAAQLDGASTLGALWRVMLPVAIPGVISTALLSFFAAWNDFFAALILITDQRLYTLPVSIGILSADANHNLDFGLMQTGVTITVLPCVVIYLVLQRYYVAGLLGGALK
jgi:multiple sugar transport system permease protein